MAKNYSQDTAKTLEEKDQWQKEQQRIAHGLAGKTITTTKPLYPPARILTGISEGIHSSHHTPYIRKVIVGGQHKAAADYVHPHLNTDTES